MRKRSWSFGGSKKDEVGLLVCYDMTVLGRTRLIFAISMSLVEACAVFCLFIYLSSCFQPLPGLI